MNDNNLHISKTDLSYLNYFKIIKTKIILIYEKIIIRFHINSKKTRGIILNYSSSFHFLYFLNNIFIMIRYRFFGEYDIKF